MTFDEFVAEWYGHSFKHEKRFTQNALRAAYEHGERSSATKVSARKNQEIDELAEPSRKLARIVKDLVDAASALRRASGSTGPVSLLLSTETLGELRALAENVLEVI
jgi:hypothetical protein